MEPAREAPSDVIAAFERASRGLGAVRDALRGVIFGQDTAVELALCAIVASGWAMITGGPGSAKTRLVRSLGQALGLETGRIVFTPDLDLDDLTRPAEGARTLDGSGAPRPQPAAGLLRQLLLADDLDRAAPRLRSALLEAAHAGGLDGSPTPLPRPFHLFATGAEGGLAGFTETEIDRFLLRIDLGAPDRDGERRMLIETAGPTAGPLDAVMDVTALLEAQRVAVELPVGEAVVEAMLDLVRRARPDDPSAPAIVRAQVARGPGPRAGQALMRLARARALIDGRASPSAADVKALAPAVLTPRLTMVEQHGARFDAAPVVVALVEAMGT
jgi:MoxR-like ATPase